MFNVSGLKWTKTSLEWYFNGKKVASVSTPSDMHQPMYILINLAIGGNWAGPPDNHTRFPARFEIDYLRVYSV